MTSVHSSRRLSTLSQALGVVAIAGAVLHVVKGAVLIGRGPDLSLVPVFMVLFATGISGFYIRLEGRSRQLGMGGLACAGVAALGGLAALGFQVQGVAPEDPDAPVGVTIAYVLGTFGILAALLLLGLATQRAAVLPRGWRAVPLIAGIVWFPLEGLTAVLPDGWGLFAAGLAWLAAGFSLVPPAAATGAFALLSGTAYAAYFMSSEVLGEWLISAWNLLILPPAVYLGTVLWRRNPWVALSASVAGITASVLWAFGFHDVALEPWWIGLGAAWWVGIGWLLRAQRSRLGWFTVTLGIAAAVDYLLTALNAPMPLYALGGFKIPMTMVWSLWLGVSLLRRPLQPRRETLSQRHGARCRVWVGHKPEPGDTAGSRPPRLAE